MRRLYAMGKSVQISSNIISFKNRYVQFFTVGDDNVSTVKR